MVISNMGLAFIARHEGFVSKAYRDPVGVLTIGYGFTMGSTAFARWWQSRHSRPLKTGDTISRADASDLLRHLIDTEYAPAVAKALPKLTRSQADACISVVYNLGPRALTWKWAKALAAGDVAQAARLLTTTGTTARGKPLPGLVRRRADEARLLETGEYGNVAGNGLPGEGAPILDSSQILLAQKSLKALGFDPGPLDGSAGSRTREAVAAFQKKHPPLTVDGVIGPATLSALTRKMSARKVGLSSLATGVGTLGAAKAGGAGMLWAFGIAAGVIVFGLALGLFWRNRGRLFSR